MLQCSPLILRVIIT